MAVHKRVIKDIQDGMKNLKKEFGIYICPEEDDFYKVHFILPGPEDTPFEGGLYHGMIRLNNNHPYSAPNIHMITPSGRFIPEAYPIPNGSRGICTTSTSFHPESWTPLNNIETLLKGFISLMCDPYDGGVQGLQSSPEQTKELAKKSIKHIIADQVVRKLFSDLHESLVDGTYEKIKLGDLSKVEVPKVPALKADSPKITKTKSTIDDTKEKEKTKTKTKTKTKAQKVEKTKKAEPKAAPKKAAKPLKKKSAKNVVDPVFDSDSDF